MLCMFQTGALQNNFNADTLHRIVIHKSYRTILNNLKQKKVAFVFTYHYITCYNCYNEIDAFFNEELKEKYYLIIPSCKKTNYPIHQQLKNAVYIFDPWLDCSAYSKYSLPSVTRSNIFMLNEVMYSPSLFVFHRSNLYYYSYHHVFNENGKLNEALLLKWADR